MKLLIFGGGRGVHQYRVGGVLQGIINRISGTHAAMLVEIETVNMSWSVNANNGIANGNGPAVIVNGKNVGAGATVAATADWTAGWTVGWADAASTIGTWTVVESGAVTVTVVAADDETSIGALVIVTVALIVEHRPEAAAGVLTEAVIKVVLPKVLRIEEGTILEGTRNARKDGGAEVEGMLGRPTGPQSRTAARQSHPHHELCVP